MQKALLDCSDGVGVTSSYRSVNEIGPAMRFQNTTTCDRRYTKNIGVQTLLCSSCRLNTVEGFSCNSQVEREVLGYGT